MNDLDKTVVRIVSGNSSTWMSYGEYKKWQAFKDESEKEFWRHIFNGTRPAKTLYESVRDRVKLALVIKDGKRIMLGVDNETMQGYEMRDDIPDVKEPLIAATYDTFERWCTSFDV